MYNIVLYGYDFEIAILRPKEKEKSVGKELTVDVRRIKT